MENMENKSLRFIDDILKTHPLDYQGQADSLVEYLFQHYSEIDPVTIDCDEFRLCAEAIDKLIQERDAALGVKSQDNTDGSETPAFNREKEEFMLNVNAVAAAYERAGFRSGVFAGAKLVFELLQLKPEA